MSSQEPLPSYDQPPVVEVAASVQFEPMPGFDVVRMGLLWERFRARYPTVEQKPPIAPQIERLGGLQPHGQVQFEFLQEPVVPRLLFVSNEGNDLVQVQGDRFLRNWRRTSQPSTRYPRYEEHVRPRFVEDYHTFQSFLADNKLDSAFSPNQCEITYVSDIRACDAWASHSEIYKVFRFFDQSYFDREPEPTETLGVQLVRLIKDSAGSFLGRLHIDVKALVQLDDGTEKQNPLFRLTMTARGRPTEAGEQGVLGFLDLGRANIVKAFDRMSTQSMHTTWGKSQ